MSTIASNDLPSIVDTTLMDETHKVSTEGHGHPSQGA